MLHPIFKPDLTQFFRRALKRIDPHHTHALLTALGLERLIDHEARS